MKPWEDQFHDLGSALRFLQSFAHDPGNMAALRRLYEEELSSGAFMLDDHALLEALAHQLVGGVFKIVPLPTVPFSPAAEGLTKVLTIKEVKKKKTKVISEGLTWIAVRLVDNDGNPVPYEPYEILRPSGGLLQKGNLNEEGYVRVDEIPAGNYTVIFPGRADGPAEAVGSDWIEVKLVYEDDKPVPHEVYEILDSAGKVYRRGQLDMDGFAREEGVAKGSYTVVFPRLGEGVASTDKADAAKGGQKTNDQDLRELHVRIDIDPGDVASWDDQFELYSQDGAYRRVQTIKDDCRPGDAYVDLVFKELDDQLRYSLKIDPGEGGEAYHVFEDVSYSELKSLMASLEEE